MAGRRITATSWHHLRNHPKSFQEWLNVPKPITKHLQYYDEWVGFQQFPNGRFIIGFTTDERFTKRHSHHAQLGFMKLSIPLAMEWYKMTPVMAGVLPYPCCPWPEGIDNDAGRFPLALQQGRRIKQSDCCVSTSCKSIIDQFSWDCCLTWPQESSPNWW